MCRICEAFEFENLAKEYEAKKRAEEEKKNNKNKRARRSKGGKRKRRKNVTGSQMAIPYEEELQSSTRS